MNQTIEITISPEGQAHVETKGFTGSSCRETTRLLERALGHVTGEQLTPAFYIPTHTEQQLPQRTQ